MNDTAQSVRRKIASASDLHAVVRTMKTLAGANIGQYEQSVMALTDYSRSVQLGLSIALAQLKKTTTQTAQHHKTARQCHVVVFGSDQGLVGRFNDVVADFTVRALATLPGEVKIWTVGSRVYTCLSRSGLNLMPPIDVPMSIDAITPLISQILLDTALPNSKNIASYPHSTQAQGHALASELHLFYNRLSSGEIYSPVTQQLLPLGDKWQRKLLAQPWPTHNLPEILGDAKTSLQALISEYLFVSLFRACTESLASENASRLAAMQRADKNIDELLTALNATFHQIRQNAIDEELFDVTSGFEALTRTVNS